MRIAGTGVDLSLYPRLSNHEPYPLHHRWLAGAS
jgi:hypothetical protein